MCIRDRLYDEFKIFNNQHEKLAQDWQKTAMAARELIEINTCLLYTSDAAAERSSVDLGGRRIIKKQHT